METKYGSIPLTHVKLDFNLKNQPIDFFRLDGSNLNVDNEFEIEEIDLKIQAGEYLTLEHLKSIDHSKTETVVFNIPTGRGKTNRCYDLIRKYYADGYYVFVCSPFIKLVEKDFKELREHFEAHEIFTYLDIEKASTDYRYSLIGGVQARIQIMSINLLLQNPGNEYYEQAFTKRDYLSYLKDIITAENKKIVFFFDEIHESTKNFDREFIPNLAKWITLTHKCYISSATYTPAAIPVIRYISSLTGGKIKVFSTSRVKSPIQANIHLHISTEKYHGKSLYSLKKVNTLIAGYKGRKIHILTGYKSISTALIDKRTNPYGHKIVTALEPNICTSETSNEFDESANNIGTTFKTGIDIKDPNAILIIILPAIISKESSYGIFEDGVPSIIQSIARLRNGGDIHIFMYAPNAIIDIEGHKNFIDEKLYNSKEDKPFITLNESYTKFEDRYSKKYERVSEEIAILSAFESSNKLKFQYPTQQEELVNRSQSLLVNSHESFGKGLSPYILWACINDQFCSATLKSMELITKDYQHVHLTINNISKELLKLLSDEEKEALKVKPFKLAVQEMITLVQREIKHTENEDGSIEEVTVLNKFSLDGAKKNMVDLRRINSFNQALINAIYYLKTGTEKSIVKDEYLRTCIANSIENPNGYIPVLTHAYSRLNTLKQKFINFIISAAVESKSVEKLIHIDAYENLSDDFFTECLEVIKLLKVDDGFLNQSYSFFQDLGEIEEISKSIKKSIWQEFRRTFTNIGDTRRTFAGEKNKYYLLPEVLENTSNISGVEFI